MLSHQLHNIREASFGASKLSLIDRFGTWLSRRSIQRHLKGKNNLTVLELGCGYSASNLISISEQAEHLVAVDFNLCEKIKTHAKFLAIESSIDDAIPMIANFQFDMILIISVLEHLDNPLHILSECHKMLKPGGVILVNVPTWVGKFYLEYSAFKLKLSPKQEIDEHKMYYNKRDLWPLVVKSGFLPSNIKMNYHKFGLNLFCHAAAKT